MVTGVARQIFAAEQVTEGVVSEHAEDDLFIGCTSRQEIYLFFVSSLAAI